MLVHGDKDFEVLKNAERELQQQVGHIPDAGFYERKLQAAWMRAQHSAHYAEIGPYRFSAFQQLPLTAKALLKRQPLAFCTVALGDAAKYYATTGTTGEPTPTPRLKQDIIWNAVSVAAHWRSVLRPGARVANLMPSDIVPVGDLIANVCEYLDVSHVRLYPFTTGITDGELMRGVRYRGEPGFDLAAYAGLVRALTAGLELELVLVNVQEPASAYEMLTLHDAEALAESRDFAKSPPEKHLRETS